MTSSNYRSNTSDPLASKLPSNKELADRMLSRQREQERVEVVPEGAMVPEEDDGKHWMICGVRLDKKGATIPDEISKQDFDFVWNAIFGFKERVNLWIGDWLVACERVHSKTYKEMSAQLGLAVGTLYNYHRVCSSVEISRRSEKLGYSHYALLAAMDPDTQDYWIDFATAPREPLSVEALRNAINDYYDRSPALPDVDKVFTNDNERRIAAIFSTLRRGRAVEQGDIDFLRDLVKIAKSRL